MHRKGILGRRNLHVPTAQDSQLPTLSLQPGSSTPYHAVPSVSHNSRLAPPSHTSSRRFTHAPTTTPYCCVLAPRTRLLLTSSTASIATYRCCQTGSNQPEFDRPARDIQSSAHYRYLLAYPHRPRHGLAHPPLPGPPHCQLLIKSISPLSRVTSRFLPINSLIPLTNFGNPKSHLSLRSRVAISYHYRCLSVRIWIAHANHLGLNTGERGYHPRQRWFATRDTATASPTRRDRPYPPPGATRSRSLPAQTPTARPWATFRVSVVDHNQLLPPLTRKHMNLSRRSRHSISCRLRGLPCSAT